ncbi:MAG: hypothetical protein JNL67_15740 [Planctomycetaceae bacterium]|nr:hypothetical protein [Planctomycetaceae bacterium]
MNDKSNSKAPLWFWAIAVVALLWNLMGGMIFLMEMFAQEAAMEGMTDTQKAWVRATPSWIYVVFGVSVLTGLLGSVGLLWRMQNSVILFSISLVAVLIQMIYTMVIAGGLQVMGPSGAIMPAIVIVLAFTWLFASIYFSRQGWLCRASSHTARS